MEELPSDDGLTWEERYHQADAQLQKFRQQAGRVRELLNQKLTEYEDKVAQAEAEKEQAQEKVKRLEASLKVKEEAGILLREKITVLRDERARENGVWEEREKIMKNWIKSKITLLLQELETAREEKKDIERRLVLENEKRRDENEDGDIYEEIFDQLLGGLKKPKFEPIWDHSQPNSPVPMTPKRISKAIETEPVPTVRAKLMAPEPPFRSRPMTSIRRCDSDDYGIRQSRERKTPAVPSKLAVSPRFSERRFSDITSPYSAKTTSPVPARRNLNKPAFSPPTIVQNRKSSKIYDRPLLISTDRDSMDEDVFRPDVATTETNGAAVADGDETLKRTDSDAEPFYFTLKESLYGIEYESENKTPVYATLRGIASQIRMTPFSGESTDSEADIAESEGANDSSQSRSRFKSYIDEADTMKSDHTYDLPYDSVIGKKTPETKRKGTLFSNKNKTGTMSRGQKLLKTCAPYTAEHMRTCEPNRTSKDTMEKAGYLIKLGGRVKNWKKRWFVMMDGKLCYFKTKDDVMRKPLGQIFLEKVSSVSRSERLNTFELCTPKRTYYLTADSQDVVDDWLKVLRNNLKRFSGARILARAGERTIHSGWVTKVKGGVSTHCWCVLRERTLLFYKSESDQNPFSAVNLREIINVQLCEAGSDIYLGEDDGRCTLMIQTLQDNHPTYLVIPSMSELDEWRIHIINLNNDEYNKALESDFENVVTHLMSVEGDSGSRFWQDPLLVHSRTFLSHSLSTLQSSELNAEAVKIFKSISLYSTTPISEQAIDYHISLAQDTIQSCLNHPELQTEIYCQLIKQTTKVVSKGGNRQQIQNLLSGQSDWMVNSHIEDTIDHNPIPEYTYIQCWQLLALCTSLFLPKLKILWLLKAHLKKWANPSTETGRYALYCVRSLERAFTAGEREARPSRHEVLSMVLRNPYYLPFPMSIPVYFVNNTYQVFSFDGSTTIAEFCERINTEIGIRPCSESGYALFSDNPIASVEHCLQAELKFCDVISKWEQAMKCLGQGKVEKQRVIKLTYKNRLFFKSLSKTETNKERFLLCYQVNESILAGHLQPAPETAFQLAALLAQIEFGGYSDNFKNLNKVVSKFVPDYHKGSSKSGDMGAINRKMYKSIAESWSNLRGKSINDCVNSYLGIVRSFPLFGSKLFEAKERIFNGKKEEQRAVIMAVEEEKLTILDYSTRTPITTYNFTSVITFGGYKDDFMLVIQDDVSGGADRTGRHLYAMSKGKVLEITFLVASYINTVVARRGLNLELRKDKPRSESNPLGNRGSVLLWDMESFG